LAVIAVLVTVGLVGLLRHRDAATLDNVAFAGLHASVLLHGVLGAIAPSLATTSSTALEDVDAVAA
jgi:hypothetical protein